LVGADDASLNHAAGFRAASAGRPTGARNCGPCAGRVLGACVRGEHGSGARHRHSCVLGSAAESCRGARCGGGGAWPHVAAPRSGSRAAGITRPARCRAGILLVDGAETVARVSAGLARGRFPAPPWNQPVGLRSDQSTWKGWWPPVEELCAARHAPCNLEETGSWWCWFVCCRLPFAPHRRSGALLVSLQWSLLTLVKLSMARGWHDHIRARMKRADRAADVLRLMLTFPSTIFAVPRAVQVLARRPRARSRPPTVLADSHRRGRRTHPRAVGIRRPAPSSNSDRRASRRCYRPSSSNARRVSSRDRRPPPTNRVWSWLPADTPAGGLQPPFGLRTPPVIQTAMSKRRRAR